MKIAVDAMGGDNAPAAIIAGGLEAAKLSNGQYEVVFVGDVEKIEKEIARHPRLNIYPFSIMHASQCISMCEAPAGAFKKKPDASIAVCHKMQRQAKVQAVVTMGDTGAAMASALLTLGRLPGIHRPALGSILPTYSGVTCILDVGAMMDCKPKNLLQFAVMGSVFMEQVVGISRPKVGLLSVGKERRKGNENSMGAYGMLEKGNVNFIGNIEGSDILRGTADVVVCDGFVGNVLLKFAESVSGLVSLHMKKHIGKKILSNFGAFLLKPTFKGLRKIWDYEEYGGALLLGANGVVIIGHGRSTPKAVMNAIQEAAKMVQQGVNEHIKLKMQVLNGI